MGVLEVKMPAGAKDLRIKHFKSLAVVPTEGRMDEQTQILFLADFLGLRYNQILDFRKRDVRKMIELALSAISKMDLTSKLPETITLGGKQFYRADPDKVGIGWQIDFKATQIKKDPVRLACLFYLPVGYNYSDMDVNGNITHPIDSRYELFEQEFPLDLFIRAANFFLIRYLNSMKVSTVAELWRTKAKGRTSSLIRSLNPFSGKQVSKR